MYFITYNWSECEVIVMSKRQYGKSYSKEDLLKAVHEFSTGKIGFNKCCQKYSIPKPTLKRHVEGKVIRGFTYKQVNGRLPVFAPDVEKELSLHLRNLDDHFCGITIGQVCKLAYDMPKSENMP